MTRLSRLDNTLARLPTVSTGSLASDTDPSTHHTDYVASGLASAPTLTMRIL